MNIRTILKNIGALFGAQIVTSLLTPILFITIARTLGDTVFGKYSFLFALTSIFLVLTEFGIQGVAIRDIARDPSKVERYLGNIVALRIVFSIFFIIIYVLFIHGLNMPKDTTQASYIFAMGLFFQSMSYAFRWVFHATQIMEYEAIQRALERILLLVLSVLVLWKGFGLIPLSLVFMGTQMIICVLSVFLALRIVRIRKIKLDVSFCRYLIKTAVFFALCKILWMLYFKIDMVMLAKIRGEAEVGWYNASYVIVNFITLISMLSMQALFPVFSSLYERQKDKLDEVVEMLFRYFMVISLLIVPVVFTLSSHIIHVIYGTDYVRSIDALRILILAVFFVLQSHLFSNILATSNRHKILALLNLSGVLLNVALNFILIPKRGYIGAGIATVVTECVMCILLYVVLSRFIKIHSAHIILRSLPAFAVMVVILYIAKDLALIPGLIVSVIIYLFLAFIMGCIKKEDFAFVLKAIDRKPSDFVEY